MAAILDLCKFDPLNSESQLGKHQIWIQSQKYYKKVFTDFSSKMPGDLLNSPLLRNLPQSSMTKSG